MLGAQSGKKKTLHRLHSLKCTASFGFNEPWKYQRDDLQLSILMFISPQIALIRKTVASVLYSIALHASTFFFLSVWLSQIINSVKEHRISNGPGEVMILEKLKVERFSGKVRKSAYFIWKWHLSISFLLNLFILSRYSWRRDRKFKGQLCFYEFTKN